MIKAFQDTLYINVDSEGRHTVVNREGLTWQEWRLAAGNFGVKEASAWRKAWAAGEDSTEWARG